MSRAWRSSLHLRFGPALALVLWLAGCVRPGPNPPTFTTPNAATPGVVTDGGATSQPAADPSLPLQTQLGTPAPAYNGQPTPDPAHYETGAGGAATLGSHTVAVGETLGILAQRYGTTVEELMRLNGLTNPDLVQLGQALQVPGGEIQQVVSPDFKIIPDSELVYGPAARDFEARSFVSGLNGYLLRVSEEVEGQALDGPAILQLVADRHSVNPRLLLAVVEHRTGWVTQATPAATTADLGAGAIVTPGLYGQLSFAANLLNLGFYGRAEGGLRGFNLGDDTQVLFSAVINDGTAGVQRYLGAISGTTRDAWLEATGATGLYATYQRLFGNPFGYAVEPLLPAGVAAPPLVLPWAAGETLSLIHI